MSGDGLCNGINASGEGEGDAYDVDCGAMQRAMHSTIRARKQLMKMTPTSQQFRAGDRSADSLKASPRTVN